MKGEAENILREELIEYVTNADVHKLEMIQAFIKEEETDEDWWDELTDEQKASIEEGLRDAKAGRIIPHEEVMKKLSKWLSK